MERSAAGGAWERQKGRPRRRRRREAEAASDPERRLHEARSELQSSDFWDSSRRTILSCLSELLGARQAEAPGPTVEAALSALESLRLTRPREEPGARLQCVCYGLGSFSSCAKARCQLALLLLLLEELQIPPHLCYTFDPVFSAPEREILTRLGLTVLQENEEGKRPVHAPTLFYMIHCGKALYNNLLWSNWRVEALSGMVIVGNSFQGVRDRVLTNVLEKDYAYIAKILAATEEEVLPTHPSYLDVFNDTSVHCFPLSKLRHLPQETWTSQKEPVYQEDDQLEIIRNP